MPYRLFLYLLSASALLSTPLALPAQPSTELAVTRATFDLPQVSARVNDHYEGQFIVDTAATESVLTYSAISQLGIAERGQPAIINGATGPTHIYYFPLENIRLGNRVYRSVGAYGIPQLTSAVHADGIIGADILRRQPVEFDLPNGAIRIHDQRADMLRRFPSGSWDSVEVYHRTDGFLIVNVQIGRTILPALVDTGASQNFINHAAANALGLTIISDSDSREPIEGASGQRQTINQMQLSGFRIGDTHFGPALLGVVDLAIFDTLGMGNRPAMILSANAIGERRFVLDYLHERILFERGSR